MKTLLKILALPVLIAFSCNRSEPSNLYQQTIKYAGKSNKIILLDFTAKWCGGCKAYDKFVFQDSSLIKKLKKDFVLFKVDYEIPENSILRERFQIYGLPHLVLFDCKENILGSIQGFDSKYAKDPDLFMLRLYDIVKLQEEIHQKETIFKQDTSNVEIVNQLLDLYKKVDHHIKIQRLTNLLVKIDPDPDKMFEFNFRQAIEKLQKENNPQSIQIFLNENPNLDYIHSWEALSQLLYYYRDINDIKKQDIYYLKLIKIDPKYFNMHYAEFLFENKMKLDTAIILSNEINSIPGFRNNHWGQFLDAHSLASTGEIGKAVQQYSKWMEKNKDIWISGEDYWILYFYAKFANFYGVDLENALKYIQIAEKNRNMIDEKVLMADILYKLGRIDESIEKLEESLDISNNPNEYNRIETKIKDFKTQK